MSILFYGLLFFSFNKIFPKTSVLAYSRHSYCCTVSIIYTGPCLVTIQFPNPFPSIGPTADYS